MAAVTAILGAGAWGTALAVMLARGGHQVRLCVRRAEHAREIEASRENRLYLAGVAIPSEVQVVHSWQDGVRGADVVVLAVPSRFARAAISGLADSIAREAVLVSATKGIEEHSLHTMTAMIAETIPGARAYAVLAGPGFAAEVARAKPAALVAASADESAARELQNLFAARSLRIYRSADVAGVELCGAVKNVIAIAAGISDGLELGSSARAAVITRGLAEIARLIEAAGGSSQTVMGLAGLGDLVLTCTGELSRNRGFGLRVGREGGVHKIAEAPGPVAEGVSNARSVQRLAARYGIEMPISAAVYRTLYEAKPPQDMVEELLSRALKSEF